MALPTNKAAPRSVIQNLHLLLESVDIMITEFAPRVRASASTDPAAHSELARLEMLAVEFRNALIAFGKNCPLSLAAEAADLIELVGVA